MDFFIADRTVTHIITPIKRRHLTAIIFDKRLLPDIIVKNIDIQTLDLSSVKQNLTNV
jgi:hypothetical protein